jgi:Tol biopolymer transport system component
MTERWRTELRRVEGLSPDEDLVERALDRPRLPLSEPRPRVRIAIIAIALLIPALTMYGIFALFRARTVAPPARTGAPAAAPSATGEILYAKATPGWSLYALDLVTGTERRTTDGVRDYASDWSPDGTRIVFEREQDGNVPGGIWVVNADGFDATQIAEDGRVPNWSPDGSTIAFVRLQGPGESLYLMDADGSDVRPLTPAGSVQGDRLWYPTWSPDGSEIAFVSFHGNETDVYVMKADGSGVRQLASNLEVFGPPAWSPDGASITLAINGQLNGPVGGIALLATDGSGDMTFVPGTRTEYPNYVDNPTWSPDGRWLAYVQGHSGQIMVVRPDGSDGQTFQVDPGGDSIEELDWGP